MDGVLRQPALSIAWALGVCAIALIGGEQCLALDSLHDLAVTPLFDGERSELMNNWGGAWARGNAADVALQSRRVHSGHGALAIELRPTDAKRPCYVQCLASGFGRTPAHYQTRDLRRYEQLAFYVRSEATAALHASCQLKDYRDSAAHRATYRFPLPAGADWTRVDVPLAPDDPRWTVDGDFDWGRILSIDLFFEAEDGPASGRVYLDDVVLVEPGGPVDVATAPLESLLARLARRQWDALWAARSRAHGMIPNNSYQATDAALNATATVVWMLPAAVRHGWIEQAEADRYAELLVGTLDRLLDRSRHLPPRNVDWVTLEPSLLPEESSVDAAFLALGLHQYKSLPSTPPALREAIDRTENRFDFAAFVGPSGWRMAYRYATRACAEGFVGLTYNGYTNEGNLISLAAHLSTRRHVPVETCWNASTHRVRTELAGLAPDPVVHSLSEYRAPFAQALWNLFVDVRDRGVDCYPDGVLAVNPWQNFTSYEQNVMARLAKQGRPHFVQPDAGDDGTLSNYRQFSLYEDFGQHDLFMPWSAALTLLAGADRADQSLRFLLAHRLHGPLGLADSARWATGAADPYAVTARQDFWNTGLATMALLERLDGPSRASKSFAELPEVRAALDCVFRPKPKDTVAVYRPEAGPATTGD